MNSNLKFFLAVIGGLAAGGALVAVIETMGHFFFPPPDNYTIDLLCEHIVFGPLMVLIFPLIAWTLGSFLSGVIAKLIYRKNNKPAFISGLVLLVFVLANLIIIGCHPLWMEIISAIVPVPLALLGSRLVAAR